MADELESLDLFADAILAQGNASLDGEIEVIPLPESLEEPCVTEDVALQIDPELEAEKIEMASSGVVEELDTTIEADNTGQMAFIDFDKWWKVEWQGMPEFVQDDRQPWKTLNVHFLSREDMMAFMALVGQRLTNETRAIWYPESLRKKHIHLAYMDAAAVGRQRKQSTKTVINTPRYPVYVISKGRWESRLTVKALERLGVPYKIVVEPQEYAQYAAVIDPQNILQTPFSNLGQGSIPVRNWVWEHAIALGVTRHWILDDNIRYFMRMNHNQREHCLTGAIFCAAENFVDYFENIAIAGMQYKMFALDRTKYPPFYLNTRVYSCILIKNDLSYRWRGRYNEDTDLSIRALKDGWCTVLFYAFLADKIATMTMTGGNTEALYQDDGRLKMAQSLVEQHPDIVTIVKKWGRWQHQVDYRSFKKNRLVRKADVVRPEGVDNYGMELRTVAADDAFMNEVIASELAEAVENGGSDVAL